MRKVFQNFFKLILSLLLIFVVLFHANLYIFVFKGFEISHKREIRKFIKEGIPESDLIEFVFSKKDLRVDNDTIKWIKSWEFRYFSEMYDIVREEESTDSVLLYCIHDPKESQLFANLDKYLFDFFSNNPDKSRELGEHLINYTKYYLPYKVSNISLFYFCSDFNFFTINQINNLSYPVDHPPPKFYTI